MDESDFSDVRNLVLTHDRALDILRVDHDELAPKVSELRDDHDQIAVAHDDRIRTLVARVSELERVASALSDEHIARVSPERGAPEHIARVSDLALTVEALTASVGATRADLEMVRALVLHAAPNETARERAMRQELTLLRAVVAGVRRGALVRCLTCQGSGQCADCCDDAGHGVFGLPGLVTPEANR